MQATDYRVPTSQVGVTIEFCDARTQRVSLYLPAEPGRAGSARSVAGYLSSAPSFIAVRCEDEVKELINRDLIAVVWAGASAGCAGTATAGSTPTIDFVQLETTTGRRIVGTLVRYARPELSRVSDHFNGERGFVTLETESGVAHVNRKHIVRVLL